MKITVPELSLVVLIGSTASGKSTFATRHFRRTEVVSSDECRALVADDPDALDVNAEAFGILNAIAGARLALRRLTVIDATNVQPEARKPLVALAREHDCLPVAIVFDLPESLLTERSRTRTDRRLPAHVVRQHTQLLRRSLRQLEREGFRHVFILRSPEDVDAATVERQRLWTDRRDDTGPFDIIGDVHGCNLELRELLERLGYCAGDDGVPRHPEGRRAVFLGDLVDRGPDITGVLDTAMSMVAAGTALCIPGNHEVKLLRALRGRTVSVSHGLAQSLEQLERRPAAFRDRVAAFIDGLVSHYVLDGGRLVVAHAGLAERLQGRASGRVRGFALYGETTGETDEFGLPVRHNWAADYRGKAMVVYGHVPTVEPEWINGTICIDTGCVYGGHLTALRYPERELVSVAAHEMYYEPARPMALADHARTPVERDQDVLDIDDVLGRRGVETGLAGSVTIAEANAAAALEAMSRFAVDPRWLIYLPPTMSPPETTGQEGLLEHPVQAFEHYRRAGVDTVVCQEKHMGSRAVAIVGRDAAAVRERFHIESAAGGILYTRTGRRFFEDETVESELLERLRDGIARAGLWNELGTSWVCLDTELMPWTVKARELLQQQYAAVGDAAERSFSAALATLDAALARGLDVADLEARLRSRSDLIHRYRDAYRRYCWEVGSVDDLRIAPFHLLASENGVHVDQPHSWHMAAVARMVPSAGPVVMATRTVTVDLTSDRRVQEAVDWWSDLTAKGGEGMVVKPMQFVARHRDRLVQPAIKVRGRDYLRIIYGPDYTLPGNLQRLRDRHLGLKRSLAVREFALGVEALQRFVAREGLHRVHECVFGVLALESEPVDPRL